MFERVVAYEGFLPFRGHEEAGDEYRTAPNIF